MLCLDVNQSTCWARTCAHSSLSSLSSASNDSWQTGRANPSLTADQRDPPLTIQHGGVLENSSCFCSVAALKSSFLFIEIMPFLQSRGAGLHEQRFMIIAEQLPPSDLRFPGYGSWGNPNPEHLESFYILLHWQASRSGCWCEGRMHALSLLLAPKLINKYVSRHCLCWGTHTGHKNVIWD